MKKILFLIILCLGLPALASYPQQYIETLPTTYQKLDFTIKTLTQFLDPIGYELRKESVDIGPDLALPGFTTLVKVSTPEYNVNSVLFTAIDKKTKKIHEGSIFLIIAIKDIQAKMKLTELNKTAQIFHTESFFANDQFIMLLSRNIDSSSFKIDITPDDFKL